MFIIIEETFDKDTVSLAMQEKKLQLKFLISYILFTSFYQQVLVSFSWLKKIFKRYLIL